MIEKTTEVVVKAKNITFSRAFFTAGETAETKKAKITRNWAESGFSSMVTWEQVKHFWQPVLQTLC